jgi:hypothetical protein
MKYGITGNCLGLKSGMGVCILLVESWGWGKCCPDCGKHNRCILIDIKETEEMAAQRKRRSVCNSLWHPWASLPTSNLASNVHLAVNDFNYGLFSVCHMKI